MWVVLALKLMDNLTFEKGKGFEKRERGGGGWGLIRRSLYG